MSEDLIFYPFIIINKFEKYSFLIHPNYFLCQQVKNVSNFGKKIFKKCLPTK